MIAFSHGDGCTRCSAGRDKACKGRYDHDDRHADTYAGQGKTAFTRGLAAGLGYKGRVTSPTFTIVNEYEGDIPLFHFDLYRLGSSDELFDIGWEDYLARGGVCAVEWSERAEDAFDGSTVRIDFRRGAQHGGWRVITITGVDGL